MHYHSKFIAIIKFGTIEAFVIDLQRQIVVLNLYKTKPAEKLRLISKNEDFIDAQRYLAGFQIIPNEIPGFGPIQFNDVKISMRVSAQMEDEIRAGRTLGLDILLPEATNKLGGFSDACHTLTAATTVAIGKEEQLIEEMEYILNQQVK